ncbi:hypothetical protein N0V90_002734 [Kalmusia sp. IMI 367209]|nr:hypothetical protein N0V90_002734 [Kalmusia sp. IMI 367209]
MDASNANVVWGTSALGDMRMQVTEDLNKQIEEDKANREQLQDPNIIFQLRNIYEPNGPEKWTKKTSFQNQEDLNWEDHAWFAMHDSLERALWQFEEQTQLSGVSRTILQFRHILKEVTVKVYFPIKHLNKSTMPSSRDWEEPVTQLKDAGYSLRKPGGLLKDHGNFLLKVRDCSKKEMITLGINVEPLHYLHDAREQRTDHQKELGHAHFYGEVSLAQRLETQDMIFRRFSGPEDGTLKFRHCQVSTLIKSSYSSPLPMSDKAFKRVRLTEAKTIMKIGASPEVEAEEDCDQVNVELYPEVAYDLDLAVEQHVLVEQGTAIEQNVESSEHDTMFEQEVVLKQDIVLEQDVVSEPDNLPHQEDLPVEDVVPSLEIVAHEDHLLKNNQIFQIDCGLQEYGSLEQENMPPAQQAGEAEPVCQLDQRDADPDKDNEHEVRESPVQGKVKIKSAAYVALLRNSGVKPLKRHQRMD